MWSNPQFPADLTNLLKKSLVENFIFCTVFIMKLISTKVTIRGWLNIRYRWYEVDLQKTKLGFASYSDKAMPFIWSKFCFDEKESRKIHHNKTNPNQLFLCIWLSKDSWQCRILLCIVLSPFWLKKSYRKNRILWEN